MTDTMPRPFTISDAVEVYAEDRDDVRTEMASVVAIMRKAHVDLPFKNSSYIHALALTELMMERTTRDFRMLTGPFGDTFARHLWRPFCQMLSRMSVRKQDGHKVHARILIDDPTTRELPPVLLALSEHYHDVLTVKPLVGTYRFGHFIIGDESCRDEDRHEPYTLNTDASAVHAKVYFGREGELQGGIKSPHFEGLWDRAERPASAEA